ncbi:MAG: DMT family transporter [Paracoccaceae bacterium]
MSPNLRGSLFMVAAMAGFAVEDGFLKAASREMPVGQVILLVGLVGMLAFGLQARAAGQPAFPRALFSRGMAIRSGFEITGRLFYSLAVALTPISVASAILQATPLVVVGAAAVIFGEKVGLARWLAVVAGFIGVLMILRPGLDGFDAMSLLALTGMLGFAGRDLATRAAPPALSNAQLGVAGFAMLGLSGAVILMVTGGAVAPSAYALLLTGATAVFAVAGYAALTAAMRTGEVAVVTPFRYTRLVFALILGVLIYAERPDAMTLAGSAVIVASGIFALTRARR